MLTLGTSGQSKTSRTTGRPRSRAFSRRIGGLTFVSWMRAPAVRVEHEPGCDHGVTSAFRGDPLGHMAAATVISTVAENAGLIHIVVFVVSAGVAAKVKCRAGEDTKGRRLTILRRPGYARSAPRASATPAAEPATI